MTADVTDQRAGGAVKLATTLQFWDLVLLIVGTVIGSGPFVVPAVILHQVQARPLLALTAWIAGGVLSLMGAVTYAELTSSSPHAGGLYVYLRDAFGPLPAFLYGWCLFLMISSGGIAAISVAFSAYLDRIIPLSPLGMKVASVTMIAVVAGINVKGMRKAATVQNWTTISKVSALVSIGIILLVFGRNRVVNDSGSMLIANHSLAANFGLAMLSVLWAYEGWQYCTFAAGETVNPQRDFPRAFVVGLVLLIGIFLLVNVGYLAALGPARMSNAQAVAADALGVVVGRRGTMIVSVIVLLSTFSTVNGLIATSPRVYYAMAADGVFFHWLAELDPVHRTPAAAIVSAALWAALLAVTGTFEQLLTIVLFTGWIFYGLVAASIFVYRRRIPVGARPYSVPLYPFTPSAFVIVAAVLVINTIIQSPFQAAAGIVVILTGVPVYGFWKRRIDRSSSKRGSAETPSQEDG
jgi:basic amino acid/polyamine antiporter, APA family